MQDSYVDNQTERYHAIDITSLDKGTQPFVVCDG